jgi:uncharacterized protein YkwD
MRGSGEGRLALAQSSRRARLALALFLALAALASVVAAPAGAGRDLPIARISRVEQTIVRCTNGARVANGLPALRRNHVLRHAATYHARNMLHYRFFAHRDVFGQSPIDRVARFARRGAFHWIGENIAVGNWSPHEACRAWMGSPEHRANILSPRFSMTGVGFARGAGGRTYYVQDFGSHGNR